MTLLRLHRILIVSFIAFALLFGTQMLRRYLAGTDPEGLWAAIAAGVVALSCVVYLLKAPHLRR